MLLPNVKVFARVAPKQKVCINPYLTNGFSHHYQLGESTFIFRGVKSDFLLCLPPSGSGDILFFPRASVCPSVPPSVCLSLRLSVCHKLCPLYNLKTVKDFSMKLGTLVNHDETMCHAQEP